MFKCSTHPLADLYNNLLSLGKCLSLTIRPSILNEAALLIKEPMFLGSVTSSKHTNVKLFFPLINFYEDCAYVYFFYSPPLRIF